MAVGQKEVAVWFQADHDKEVPVYHTGAYRPTLSPAYANNIISIGVFSDFTNFTYILTCPLIDCQAELIKTEQWIIKYMKK